MLQFKYYKLYDINWYMLKIDLKLQLIITQELYGKKNSLHPIEHN